MNKKTPLDALAPLGSKTIRQSFDTAFIVTVSVWYSRVSGGLGGIKKHSSGHENIEVLIVGKKSDGFDALTAAKEAENLGGVTEIVSVIKADTSKHNYIHGTTEK